ncbi:MAG: GNAT family N-acetyltransferase [Pseudolabrys sp.]
MSGVANPKLALRPMLPPDGPLLAEIFRASVEELAAEDYSESQREAWASLADDDANFAKKLSSQLTLIATLNGSPMGFVSLAGADKLDMLYVHPAAAGQGAATLLVDAIEKLAGARGAAKLTVEASDSAIGFFEKHGYTAQQRNSVTLNGEWLANTTMHKPLGGGALREA